MARCRALEAARSGGRNPYPHKFPVSIYIPDYIEKYRDTEAGARVEDRQEGLAGAA